MHQLLATVVSHDRPGTGTDSTHQSWVCFAIGPWSSCLWQTSNDGQVQLTCPLLEDQHCTNCLQIRQTSTMLSYIWLQLVRERLTNQWHWQELKIEDSTTTQTYTDCHYITGLLALLFLSDPKVLIIMVSELCGVNENDCLSLSVMNDLWLPLSNSILTYS